jgi:hypothetical protein
VQIGHGVLSSENIGPRPDGVAPNFILDVPRASAGAALGAYVGYGWTFGDVYLGGEIDSDLTTSNWNIERDPEGRMISSARRGGFAASIRAGYVVNDAFLVYAQAGAVNGVFRTDYQESGSRVVQDQTLAGWQFGVGVEVPLSNDLHVRFDYTHSEFDSYQIDSANGTDSLDPEENLFRTVMENGKMCASRIEVKTIRGAILAGVAVAALTTLTPDWAGAQGHGRGEAAAGAGHGGAVAGHGGTGGASGGQGGRSMESILSEEDDSEDGPDWAGERGGNPDRGVDNVGQGGRAEDKGGRPEGVGGGDEDSDRP